MASGWGQASRRKAGEDAWKASRKGDGDPTVFVAGGLQWMQEAIRRAFRGSSSRMNLAEPGLFSSCRFPEAVWRPLYTSNAVEAFRACLRRKPRARLAIRSLKFEL